MEGRKEEKILVSKEIVYKGLCMYESIHVCKHLGIKGKAQD